MTGLDRRESIIKLLKEANEPLSASSLAKSLGVSRQIIVGDVALIRAGGVDIYASPRGYILPSSTETKITRKIVCQHDNEGTRKELLALVDCGCKVLNVIVDHPVYGQLTGQLEIASRIDVDEFLNRCKEENAHSLCELTDGLHIHTIECPSESAYNKAMSLLREYKMIIDD